jgi:hypothetical protein
VFSSTWARVLGSSAVNELRVGYVRGIYGDSIDQIDPTQFGIQNTTLQTRPRFFLSAGNLNYGGFSASVIAETQDTFQVSDNFSLVRGRHALKVGFNWSYNKFDNTEFFGSNGTATFSGIYTTGNSNVTATREKLDRGFPVGHGRRDVAQPGERDQGVQRSVRAPTSGRLETRRPPDAQPGAAPRIPSVLEIERDGRGRCGPGRGRPALCRDPQVAELSNSPLVVCCASSRAVDGDKNDFAPRVAPCSARSPPSPQWSARATASTIRTRHSSSTGARSCRSGGPCFRA